MRRFVEGTDRGQSTLFPECLEDWIDEDKPVRVIDVFVEELDLGELGFGGVDPEATGRPSYHPSILLKLYIYGGLNTRLGARSANGADPAAEPGCFPEYLRREPARQGRPKARYWRWGRAASGADQKK